MPLCGPWPAVLEPGENLLTYGTNILKRYHPYLKLAEAQITAGQLDAAAETLRRSEQVGREPVVQREQLQGRLAAARAARATPPPTPVPTAIQPTPRPSLAAISTPTATPTPQPTPEPTPTLRASPSPTPSPALAERTTATPSPVPARVAPTVPPQRTPTPRAAGAEGEAGNAGARAPMQTGRLEVYSSPPAARVYIDDALIGTTDPTFGRLIVPEVGIGEHTLRLAADGHDDVSKSVVIAAGESFLHRQQLPSRGVSMWAIALGFALIALVAVAIARLRRRLPTIPAADAEATWSLEPEGFTPLDATAVSSAATQVRHAAPRQSATPSTPGTPSSPSTPVTPVTPERDFPLRFGEFDLVGLLGRGGMAIVYRAERGAEEFALKRPRAGFLEDPQFLERFLRESEIGRTLHHPNVIRIHENGKVGEVPYFTMELLQGETVHERVKRSGPMGADEAVDIVAQIGEALDYAHNKGVIHRDLKPSNIIVLRDGAAKVMDYGIAKAQRFEGLTVTGSFLGTPEYVPPEVVEGEKADARSDLYSLGVVFYEMVTGKRPFTGQSPFQVLRMHTTEIPTPPTTLASGLPRDLEEMILRLMAKDPSERFADAEELVIALRDYQNRS